MPYSSAVVVTLASLLGVTQCKWWSITPLGSSAGRVGDSGVAAGARGIPWDGTTGFNPSGFQAPPVSLEQDFYDLTKWYIAVDFGTAYISCGV